MCCFALALGLLGPRVILFFMWVFGSRVDHAFDSWIWPLLGFLFLPWTTVMYALTWSPVGGVAGADWILVALGLVADIATYGSRAAQSRYRGATI